MSTRQVHYLQLSDLLDVVSQVSGFEIDEIATDDVIERMRHAIDAPAAERRQAIAAEELFLTIAEKAAILCERLLVEPPYRAEAGRIAFECLEIFLFRNVAVWGEHPTRTVLRFEEVVRDPSLARSTREWIIEGITEHVPSGVRSRQPSLLVPVGEPPTVVFLAGPLKSLSREKRDALDQLRTEVENALAEAATQACDPCEIRLEHPSTGMPSDASNTDSGEDEECREVWEYTSRLIAENVDALVIVDIALQSAGFGATSEFDLHCAQDGPTLYVRDAKSPSSRFLRGRAAETDLEICEYTDLSEIGPLVVDWITRRWHTIRTASRRRTDRLVQYRPLQRRLHAAWKRASGETRDLAADAAGMKVEAVSRVLTSTALLSIQPAHRLDALCRGLGVIPRAQGVRRLSDDVAPDYASLLAAAEELGWSSSTIVRLFQEAQNVNPQRSYPTRPRYQGKSDWVKRLGELDL